MVQVLERKVPKVSMDLKELSTEKLPVAEEKQEKAEEKPVKKGLLKFLKKSKYNAKYHEELVPVENVRNKSHYSNYGVF